MHHKKSVSIAAVEVDNENKLAGNPVTPVAVDRAVSICGSSPE
jgi:hypothetical protein